MKVQPSTPTNRRPFLATWARILLILALALPQAFIGAVPVAAATIDYTWTAYNDCAGTSSCTQGNYGGAPTVSEATSSSSNIAALTYGTYPVSLQAYRARLAVSPSG